MIGRLGHIRDFSLREKSRFYLLCKAKGLRSKRPMHAKRGAFVHASRVQVGGGAPTPRVLSCFSKAGKMFPIGNDRAARPSVKPRSGALNRGLQNLETPLHAQRATPTGANFLLVRKFPKEKETDCYFLRCAKSNAKSTRDFVLRPRFKSPVDTLFLLK